MLQKDISTVYKNLLVTQRVKWDKIHMPLLMVTCLLADHKRICLICLLTSPSLYSPSKGESEN